jgi:16S rRNA (cytosine967-C5)-methyltransferase
MLAVWTAPCLPESHRRQTREAAGSGAAVRASAARIVHAVRSEGRSLTNPLQSATSDFGERDATLLQALCFGTLRELPRLEALIALLLTRPLRRADRILEALIAVGLHQLTSMRIPEHAAVSATVAAAALIGRGRAAGLINATLRRFQRERESLLQQIDGNSAATWLFPDWLLQRLRAAWPDHWTAIVGASNARAPMTLRVNLLRVDREGYSALLSREGLTARALPGLDAALMLDDPVPTRKLPGFADGVVSVQDASAQHAAALLDARPGMRVLDACAAPGGKTGHILEHSDGQAALTAVDADTERLQTLRQMLQRLGLSAELLVADASAAVSSWPGAPYHRILLDAPCSATGVIRRHPDIKWLRRDEDIAALVTVQRSMLDALWPLLLPGGRLLYATCSVLPDENEAQVSAFLARHADARERPIDADWGVARSPDGRLGRQLLPQADGGDGFYYAIIEKAAENAS